MNGGVCSRGFVYGRCVRSPETARTPVRTLTGSRSNPTNPNGNFGLCFLSQCWSNTQEDLPSVKSLTLSFSPSGLGSGSGRELDLTQKVDSVPRYSRFRLTVWTGMHPWQCWQRLTPAGCGVQEPAGGHLNCFLPGDGDTGGVRRRPSLSWKDTLCVELNIPPVCVYHLIVGSSFAFSSQTFFQFSHPTHVSFLPNAAWWRSAANTCSPVQFI